MSKEGKAVQEYQVRPALRERDIRDDPLEWFYQHITTGDYDEAPSEQVSILSFLLDYEGASFEVQCALFARFAKRKELKGFVAQFNSQEGKKGKRVISYSHAVHMGLVGRWLLEEDRRISRDYPAIDRSFFIHALSAGKQHFVSALDVAQQKVAAYQGDPEEHEQFTVKSFAALIREDKGSRQAQEAGSPLAPPVDTAEPLEEPEDKGQDVQQAPPPDTSEPNEPESPDTSSSDRDVAQDTQPELRNCYDCRFIHQLKSHQRLAIISTEKSSQSEPLMLNSCPAWVCGRTKEIISVRTQMIERAISIAANCESFDVRVAKESKGEEAQPIEAHQTQDSGSDSNEDDAFVDLAKILVGKGDEDDLMESRVEGPALSAEDLEAGAE